MSLISQSHIMNTGNKALHMSYDIEMHKVDKLRDTINNTYIFILQFLWNILNSYDEKRVTYRFGVIIS